jgi:hypothetical protein
MKQDFKIHGLSKLGKFLHQFLEKPTEDYAQDETELLALMKKAN